jgi:hypothetical protein
MAMTDAHTPEERDGVSELVEALLERKHPPTSWVEHWSQADRDPVQRAWERSDAYLMMLQLLCHRWPLFKESADRAVKASLDACGSWRKIIRGTPIQADFSPEQTQWGARLPARLSNWLADYVRGKPDRKTRIADAIRDAVPTPPPLEGLTSRFAGAYALGERVVVHGQAGHGGYYLVGSTALGSFLSDEDDVLGRIAREALAGYQPNIPADAPKGGDLMKPVLKAVGARSNRQLQEEGRYCWIEDAATGFVIVPMHNGGNRGEQRGFSPLEDRAVRLKREASDSELGAALRQAFALCT